VWKEILGRGVSTEINKVFTASKRSILVKKEGAYFMEQVVVRCLACRERVPVDPGIQRVTCQNCSEEWLITWITPEQAKIKGPAEKQK
jgi:RNase P subunit RPR2